MIDCQFGFYVEIQLVFNVDFSVNFLSGFGEC